MEAKMESKTEHQEGDEELDLYGDADGLEFFDNELVGGERSSDGDLYDAAVEPSSDGQTAHPSVVHDDNKNVSATNSNASSDRNYCCYVGNMTWWTTDEDLQNLIYGAGIGELVDIKFQEERQNGKSRGIAVLVFSVESAVRQCLEKLPSKQLHGRQLAVMPYTKASLERLAGVPRIRKTTVEEEKKRSEPALNYLGTVRLGAPNPSPPVSVQPLYRPPSLFQMAPVMVAPRPMYYMAPPQQYCVPQVAYHPPHPPPPQQTYALPPPPPGGVPPHINPHVFGQTMYSHQAPPLSAMPTTTSLTTVESVSKAELEEIMNRNRTVSSSAISRAVSDAAAGDFVSAIETLVTAIALIRSSRVTEDPRCKVMITSLQVRSLICFLLVL
jgi:cleavage and polyadenylation specificity factor subunit 6/7